MKTKTDFRYSSKSNNRKRSHFEGSLLVLGMKYSILYAMNQVNLILPIKPRINHSASCSTSAMFHFIKAQSKQTLSPFYTLFRQIHFKFFFFFKSTFNIFEMQSNNVLTNTPVAKFCL